MNLSRIYAIFLRQLFLLRYNPMRFINIFIWGIVDLTIWGFLTKYLDTTQHLTISLAPIMLGAVVLWSFLIRMQQGMVLAFFEDVWSRNFLNIFSSPVTITEYLGGLILTGIATSAAALLFLFVLAFVFFSYNVFSIGFTLVAFLLILFIFGIALGIFSAAIGLRFGPSAEWIAWIIPSMLAPFASIYYPISVLPQALQFFSRIIPPTYAFEGMRSVLLTGTFTTSDAMIGSVLAIIYLLITYVFFRYVYRYVVKSGLLARFNAEDVSS